MQDGTFRDDIPLGEIFEDFQRRWDNSSSTAGSIVNHSKPWWDQEPGALDREAEQRAREAERLRRLDEPFKVGRGPIECSTSTALAILPEWCWDVNGYYRTLGVHWKATRKELREAYQALDGQSSVYLTYVLKQLVNAAVRRAYDLAPPGEPFLDDIYVQDRLKAKAAAEARRRTMAGDYTTAKEVIEEDYKFIPDTPNEGVDDQAAIDQGAPDEKLSDPDETVIWPYSYFLWKSRLGEASERMARWQALLIREIADRQEVIRLAVGSVGRMAHPYIVGSVGNQYVVFLNDKQEPTVDVARSAATALLKLIDEQNPQPAQITQREVS